MIEHDKLRAVTKLVWGELYVHLYLKFSEYHNMFHVQGACMKLAWAYIGWLIIISMQSQLSIMVMVCD